MEKKKYQFELVLLFLMPTQLVLQLRTCTHFTKVAALVILDLRLYIMAWICH